MSRPGETSRSELTLASYPWITLRLIWENLPALVIGSAISSVLCLPFIFFVLMDLLIPASIIGILTLGPIWVGLLYFESRLLDNEPGLIKFFFLGVKLFWKQGMMLGGVLGVPLVGNFFLLAWLELPGTPDIAWGGVFALTWTLAALISLYIYAFPLVVVHHQGTLVAVRNASILSSRHILNTLGLFGMAVLFAFSGYFITSGLFFFIPAIFGMFILNNLFLVLKMESNR